LNILTLPLTFHYTRRYSTTIRVTSYICPLSISVIASQPNRC